MDSYIMRGKIVLLEYSPLRAQLRQLGYSGTDARACYKECGLHFLGLDLFPEHQPRSGITASFPIGQKVFKCKNYSFTVCVVH